MDFSFTPEQDEAAELAAKILADRTTPERLRVVEAGGDRFDRELWRELGAAGLLGLAVPAEHGGAGLGLVELCRVLVEAGRRVAPLPLAAHGPAALLLAEAGSPDQRAAWLPAAATGAVVLTAALAEERDPAPQHPATRAEPDGGGFRVTGTKTLVPAGPYADAFLLSATTPGGSRILLVRPGDAGLTLRPQRGTDGDPTARLELDAVHLGTDRLVGDGAAATRLRDLLLVATAAHQLGVTEGALRLTADYARTREQFGRPIGSFQAVSQRLADGFIDTLGLRMVLWRAAWRLAEGLPAEAEVAVAKLWAADAGHRVAHTAVHVHGGVGIDLDGEAHRYFTAAIRNEHTWGGAAAQALAVGDVLAGRGPRPPVPDTGTDPAPPV